MPVAPAELSAHFRIQGPAEAGAAAREAAGASGSPSSSTSSFTGGMSSTVGIR